MAGRGRRKSPSGDPLAEAAAALYSLPPDECVDARTARALDARRVGDRTYSGAGAAGWCYRHGRAATD